jgi:signal recognition particle GTPase
LKQISEFVFNGYELVCIILTKLSSESESGSVFTIHQNSEVSVLAMFVTLHVIEFLSVTEYV